MKIQFHQYTLQPQVILNAKTSKQKMHGFLLRFYFQDLHAWGYASLHLHPNLGDLDALGFLKLLKDQSLDSFIKNYKFLIKNAYIDANLSATKFEKTDLATSHYTSRQMKLDIKEIESLRSQGFQRIKIKVLPYKQSQISFFELLEYYNRCAQDFVFIFDFNQSANFTDLKKTLDLKWDLKFYLEDPFDFSSQNWLALKEFKVPVLADQINDKQIQKFSQNLSGLVVKPTKTDVNEFLKKEQSLPILITSNMGEDIDVLTSIYWASYIKKNFPKKYLGAGYLTHKFYQASNYLECDFESLSFKESLQQMHRDTNWSEGFGWGQGKRLQDLQWSDI